MAFFHVFLPVSDYISKISSPKATKSRTVRPFTTNVVLLFENIHKNGQKRSKTGQKWHFSCFLPVSDYVSKISSPKAAKSRTIGPFTMNDGPKARQCIFVAITGGRPVYYEKLVEGPCV